jgi:hypothetical protein
MEANLTQLIPLIVKPYEDKIKALEEEIKSLKSQVNEPMTSSDITELAGAFAKAQGEFHVAGENAKERWFNTDYADFESVVAATRPYLSKYGLSVEQPIMDNLDGQSFLYTMLLHQSGQFIKSKRRLVAPKSDIQTLNSYTIALRRATYNALLGIASRKEDDDGHAAMDHTRQEFIKGTSLNAEANNPVSFKSSPDLISRHQLEELEYELAAWPDIAQNLMENYRVKDLADLKEQDYRAVITRAREIINIRKGITK